METLIKFSASGYALDELQLFSGVTEEKVIAMLSDCPVIRVAAGMPVAEPGSKDTRLYVLLRGALSTATNAQPGTVEQLTTTILPGECVGELSVLDDEIDAAKITALGESDLLVIDAVKLWQLIDESNDIARNLLRLLSFRIRATNAQLRRRQKVGEFYRQLSLLDGLTCLQNRTWLEDHLPKLIEQAHAARNPLALIMIDLDHFKQFNDKHGHQAGDDALRVASAVLSDALRPRDFAVRYGGEELMVILPNTNQQAGSQVAHRLCERLQHSVVFSDMRQVLPHITASFGVASLEPQHTAEDLVGLADQALYRAKAAGRNQVATYNDEG